MAEGPAKLPDQKSAMPPKAGQRTPFENLRQEINRLFEDLNPLDWRLPARRLSFDMPSMPQFDWPVAPAMDLVEKDEAYEIAAELPGLDEENVEIKLSNHTLTIKGEKSEEKEDKRKDYHLSERRFGAFQRSFRVPDGVDVDKIDATFTKGVLKVRLPKTSAAMQAEKKITIKPA